MKQCKHPCCGDTCRKPPKPKKTYTLKRSPVKKVSDKLKGRLVIYKKLRADFMRLHPICEAELPGCTKVATEVHHLRGRENELLNDMSYWLAVCRKCHRTITDNSKMAIQQGLSISRNHDTNKPIRGGNNG